MEDNPLILNDNLLNTNIKIKKFYNGSYDYSLRYIMVGDVNSGKSDIISRIVQEGFEPTILLEIELKFMK